MHGQPHIRFNNHLSSDDGEGVVDGVSTVLCNVGNQLHNYSYTSANV